VKGHLLRYGCIVRNIIDVVSKEAHVMAHPGDVMAHPGELQDLLTTMAESEPSPEQSTDEQRMEFGMIAWYLETR
jgi:hypothetical protein